MYGVTCKLPTVQCRQLSVVHLGCRPRARSQFASTLPLYPRRLIRTIPPPAYRRLVPLADFIRNIYPFLSGLSPINPNMGYQLILISLCLGLVKCYQHDNYYFENHKYCDDLSPYFGDINLDQIAGVWYGVEKIPHSKGEYRIERSKECFYIDIKERYVQVTCF